MTTEEKYLFPAPLPSFRFLIFFSPFYNPGIYYYRMDPSNNTVNIPCWALDKPRVHQ
ncbi:uncharacterized protein BO87DRAFT_377961 [Aspergillus neoniger CBS 115656]|uniref:Uncharacterized protein n=1 Tax=Aspergillus neoniger (strain CBS 115656) TaxID=1448310 RepID=A0A318YFI3_ASPNB|nr:hypothetical protein BO87DRAFT_377961 [Aspergillus neoniger CBS 115656]PYH32899.1 hypothetical protein BO87DRAFT_377961 [Aspergillus neoniger CBS 115656]